MREVKRQMKTARQLLSGILSLVMLIATVSVYADSSTTPAATAPDAIKGYWRNVIAGHPDEGAATYIDVGAIVDAAANKDPVLSKDQREAAASDIRQLITFAWKQPKVLAAVKNSELSVKSEQPGADGTSVVEYVIKVHQPREAELQNTVYVRKAKEGWRIVDMQQEKGLRITETIRNGWQDAHKAQPSLTFNEFVHMMVDSAVQGPKRKAASQKGK